MIPVHSRAVFILPSGAKKNCFAIWGKNCHQGHQGQKYFAIRGKKENFAIRGHQNFAIRAKIAIRGRNILPSGAKKNCFDHYFAVDWVIILP